MPKIIFILHQIGHYHKARFDALGKECDLHVIEIKSNSKEYAWKKEENSPFYKKYDTSDFMIIKSIIDEIKPNKTFVCGWSDKIYLQVKKHCKQYNLPVWCISDSRWEDKRRYLPLELYKYLLIKNFDGFLVAGTQSKNYIQKLGFNGEIRTPWDVVDNDFFIRQSQKTESIQNLELPNQYILFNARYLTKKNHHMVIDAYHQLFEEGLSLIPIVCIGNGEMKDVLIEKVNQLNLNHLIHFKDFIQYPDLPYLYQNAKFLLFPSVTDQWGLVVNESLAAGTPVLCSKNVGAFQDLMIEGKNGFSFYPILEEVKRTLLTANQISDENYAKLKITTKIPVGHEISNFVQACIK